MPPPFAVRCICVLNPCHRSKQVRQLKYNLHWSVQAPLLAAARASPGAAKAAAAAVVLLSLLAGLRVSPVIAAVLAVCLVMLGVAFHLATSVLSKDEGTPEMQEVGGCCAAAAWSLLHSLPQAALLSRSALRIAEILPCRSHKPFGMERKATLPHRWPVFQAPCCRCRCSCRRCRCRRCCCRRCRYSCRRRRRCCFCIQCRYSCRRRRHCFCIRCHRTAPASMLILYNHCRPAPQPCLPPRLPVPCAVWHHCAAVGSCVCADFPCVPLPAGDAGAAGGCCVYVLVCLCCFHFCALA